MEKLKNEEERKNSKEIFKKIQLQQDTRRTRILRNLGSQEKCWRRKNDGNGRIPTEKKPNETTGN